MSDAGWQLDAEGVWHKCEGGIPVRVWWMEAGLGCRCVIAQTFAAGQWEPVVGRFKTIGGAKASAVKAAKARLREMFRQGTLPNIEEMLEALVDTSLEGALETLFDVSGRKLVDGMEWVGLLMMMAGRLADRMTATLPDEHRDSEVGRHLRHVKALTDGAQMGLREVITRGEAEVLQLTADAIPF